MSYPAWFCVCLWTIVVYAVAVMFSEGKNGGPVEAVGGCFTCIIVLLVICVGCWSLHGMVVEYKAFVP